MSSIGATREYPLVRVAMRLRAQCIRAAITSLSSVGSPNLTEPTVHELPFPFAGEPKPHDRFMIDNQANTFKFVGRQIYSNILDAIVFELNRSLNVNVTSDKQNGKSHLVAAGVSHVMKEGKSVVYLPRAYDFAMNPLDYLRAALLTNYCQYGEDCFFIMDCDNIEELVDWCEQKDFILVVDQVESIESDSPECGLPLNQKRTAEAILSRLYKNRPVLRCYAAGSHLSIKRFTSFDQRSERDIEIKSSFEKVEKEMIEKVFPRDVPKLSRSKTVI